MLTVFIVHVDNISKEKSFIFRLLYVNTMRATDLFDDI